MTIHEVNAYLMFPGTAAQAIAFYGKALGAKVESSQTFGDLGGEMAQDPAVAARILHASLRIGPTAVLVSDTHPSMQLTLGHQTNVHLAFTDRDAGGKVFGALAEGGEITMPYQDMPWGSRHGQLTDRFGINWMISAEEPK